MAIKILIRRTVPEDKARKMIPLFKQMRQMAIATTTIPRNSLSSVPGNPQRIGKTGSKAMSGRKYKGK